MNYIETRAALITQVQYLMAIYQQPSPMPPLSEPVFVEYPNGPLYDESLPGPYVGMDIVFRAGTQMDLGDAPLTGSYGQLILAACVKTGTGSLAQTAILQALSDGLKYKALGTGNFPVQVYAPQPQPELISKGWSHLPILFNFEVHSL